MVYPGPGPVLVETHAVVQSPTPSGVPDQPIGPGPSPLLANDGPGSVSPSPSEHAQNADAQQPQAYPPLQTPVPVALGSTTTTLTNRPPSAFDLSDPNILARLAQLHTQVQMPSQPQSQTSVSCQPSMTTIPPSTSASESVSLPVLAQTPAPAPSTFLPHVQPSQPTNHPHPSAGIILPPYPAQSFIGTPTPLYPPSTSTAHNPTIGTSQSPVLTTTTTTTTTTSAPIPTTQASPIAPTALTYDSFWSTHTSSTGSTRALYRTHTGFTASATPAGNVAMLTPGGHAAVMTAEGVYVGGGNSRSS